MSLLKTDVVKALEKEGQDALGVFKVTLDKLKNTNKKISMEKGIRYNKRLALEKEEEALSLQEKRNEKLMSKINDFLSVD